MPSLLALWKVFLQVALSNCDSWPRAAVICEQGVEQLEELVGDPATAYLEHLSPGDLLDQYLPVCGEHYFGLREIPLLFI